MDMAESVMWMQSCYPSCCYIEQQYVIPGSRRKAYVSKPGSISSQSSVALSTKSSWPSKTGECA